MEEQERIRSLSERTGLTEDESWILYYLNRAADHWDRLPGTTRPDHTEFWTSYRHILGLLTMRVLERDRPEGWRPAEELEEDTAD